MRKRKSKIRFVEAMKMQERTRMACEAPDKIYRSVSWIPGAGTGAWIGTAQNAPKTRSQERGGRGCCLLQGGWVDPSTCCTKKQEESGAEFSRVAG